MRPCLPAHDRKKGSVMLKRRFLTLLACLLTFDIALRVIDRVLPTFLGPRADAQAAASPVEKVALATIQGPANQPWVYLYDVDSQRLAAYQTGNGCIELRGVRQVTYDLKLVELLGNLCSSHPTVKQVKDIVEKK